MLTNEPKQLAFLEALNKFIDEVEDLKQFRGKAAVLTVLRRIPNRACFQK